MKTLQVTHGPKHSRVVEIVELLGILENAPLKPAMARQAARAVAGHEYGVDVLDPASGIGYIIYKPNEGNRRNSHRRYVLTDAEEKYELSIKELLDEFTLKDVPG